MKTILQTLGALVFLLASMQAEPVSPPPTAGDGLLAVRPPATGLTFSSLLDPAKFSMNHSYTFGFTSDGKNAFYSGLYLNTIQYQVSPSLTLRLKWGLCQVPQASGNGSYFSVGNSPVLPGVEVRYQPWENMVLKIQYLNFSMPPPASPFHRFIE